MNSSTRASGRYQNASEVLREGLRLVEQRDRQQELRLQALRSAIDAGAKNFDEGRFVEVQADEICGFVDKLGNIPTEKP